MNNIIDKILKIWNFHKFKGASYDNLILGAEYNWNFVIKHSQKLKIGTKTVISGDCFINAMGGGKYWKILSYSKRIDYLQS